MLYCLISAIKFLCNNNLGQFFMFYVGLSLCIRNDTILSDCWDDCEAFHSEFNSSSEILNESFIPTNTSLPHEPDQSNELTSAMQTAVPGETYLICTSPSLYKDSNQWEELMSQWQYEAPEELLIDTAVPHHPQPLNRSESTTPLLIEASYELEELLSELQHKVPEETSIETTIPHQPQPSNHGESTSEDVVMTEPQKNKTERRMFVTIGQGSKKTLTDISVFKNLKPGRTITYTHLRDEVPIILHSLSDKHRWKELSDYPIQDYYGYWVNVCDYFWVKTVTNDELFRGCYVEIQIFPYSDAVILHMFRDMYIKSGKLELLKCQCYFYSHNSKKPNSIISKFAVHKFRNSEYFILKAITGKRNSYRINYLLTHVYLPNPRNNLALQESNTTEEPSTEPQNDTEMIASLAKQSNKNLQRRKFWPIRKGSNIGHRISSMFHNIPPGKSNRHKLSQEKLELEFVSQKNKSLWIELKQYSFGMYLEYWGNVCDYFWKKPTPDDERFRGCYVRNVYYPQSFAFVCLSHISDAVNTRKLDILQCECYYYVKYQTIPDSNQTEFAIYKHRDNEFFILDKVPHTRFGYAIWDLLTEVYLPDPTN